MFVSTTDAFPHADWEYRANAVRLTRVSTASGGSEPLGCSIPYVPRSQWPPSGPHVDGEIE